MFGSALSQTAKEALALLGKSGVVKDGYLAGGTALALHYGHRLSEDLDFFSSERFDPRKLSLTLQKLGRFEETLAKGISLMGSFSGVKFSYFHYDYPLIESSFIYLGVAIAHPNDIAAMKLVAVMDRGTKRDFVDLFELVHHGVDIEQMFSFYEKKYHVYENNRLSLIKALSYFDEADETQMPKMLKQISWEKIKKFFIEESIRLGKKYLE